MWQPSLSRDECINNTVGVLIIPNIYPEPLALVAMITLATVDQKANRIAMIASFIEDHIPYMHSHLLTMVVCPIKFGT